MAGRGKSQNAKPRPSWWTPAGYLERLEAGESPQSIAMAAAAEAKLNLATITREVLVWRDTEPDFAARQLAVLTARGESIRPRNGPKTSVLATPEERGAFIEALATAAHNYAQAPSMKHPLTAAAEACGVALPTLYAKLNPKNACFDPLFASQVGEAEGAIKAKVEGALLWNAVEGPFATGNPLLLLKLAGALMPEKYSERMAIDSNNTTTVNTTTTEVRVIELGPATLAALERMRGRLLPPAEEREVIDLTPVAAELVQEPS